MEEIFVLPLTILLQLLINDQPIKTLNTHLKFSIFRLWTLKWEQGE